MASYQGAGCVLCNPVFPTSFLKASAIHKETHMLGACHLMKRAHSQTRAAPSPQSREQTWSTHPRMSLCFLGFCVCICSCLCGVRTHPMRSDPAVSAAHSSGNQEPRCTVHLLEHLHPADLKLCPLLTSCLHISPSPSQGQPAFYAVCVCVGLW